MAGNFISFSQAAEMTARFRANQESILDPQYRNQEILYTCETFDRSWLDTLLAEDGAAGLRFYTGMDEKLKTRLIIVAVDKEGHDLVPAAGASTKAGASGFKIGEEGQRCPTNCPPPPPSGL